MPVNTTLAGRDFETKVPGIVTLRDETPTFHPATSGKYRYTNTGRCKTMDIRCIYRSFPCIPWPYVYILLFALVCLLNVVFLLCLQIYIYIYEQILIRFLWWSGSWFGSRIFFSDKKLWSDLNEMFIWGVLA